MLSECRSCTSHAQNRSPHFKSSPQFPQDQANIFHHHWSESTTSLFSSPNNMASNFNSRHQRQCGGNFFLAYCRTRRLPAPGKHSSSSLHRTWENPAGQHSAPAEMGRALIISWQKAILLLLQFLQAHSNNDFGKKNAGWHIIFYAAASNQRCENGIPMKSPPIQACWFFQGEGAQVRVFPVLPTQSTTSCDQTTMERCSLLLHMGGFQPCSLLWSQHLTLCALHCKPLLLSCQEFCHKNF